jgi:hypothetical protein
MAFGAAYECRLRAFRLVGRVATFVDLTHKTHAMQTICSLNTAARRYGWVRPWGIRSGHNHRFVLSSGPAVVKHHAGATNQ